MSNPSENKERPTSEIDTIGIYLSGAITDDPNFEEKFKELRDAVDQKGREMFVKDLTISKPFTIYCPTTLNSVGLSWEECMAKCMLQMKDMDDVYDQNYIAFFDLDEETFKSRGMALERQLAKSLGWEEIKVPRVEKEEFPDIEDPLLEVMKEWLDQGYIITDIVPKQKLGPTIIVIKKDSKPYPSFPSYPSYPSYYYYHMNNTSTPGESSEPS